MQKLSISGLISNISQRELGKDIILEIYNEFEFLPMQKILSKNNFTLYVFGGFIRDVYHKRLWHDVDIRVVTELPIRDAAKKFKSVIKNFGTITGEMFLNEKGDAILFRVAPYYTRNHKKIDFILANTYNLLIDFTIHAIYFNLETHQFIDKYNGLKDLKNKIIRTSKQAEQHFKAYDGLLHFRVIKIACLTNFKIEKETYSNFISTANLVSNLFRRLKNSRGFERKVLLHDIFGGFYYNPKLYMELVIKSGVFKEMIAYIQDEF